LLFADVSDFLLLLLLLLPGLAWDGMEGKGVGFLGLRDPRHGSDEVVETAGLDMDGK